jgi:hypothetical protein
MVVDLILALRNLSLQLPLRQQRKKELSSTPLSVKIILAYFPFEMACIDLELAITLRFEMTMILNRIARHA